MANFLGLDDPTGASNGNKFEDQLLKSQPKDSTVSRVEPLEVSVRCHNDPPQRDRVASGFGHATLRLCKRVLDLRAMQEGERSHIHHGGRHLCDLQVLITNASEFNAGGTYFGRV